MEKLGVISEINARGSKFNAGFDQISKQVLGEGVIDTVAAVNLIAGEAYDIFPLTTTFGATAVGLMGGGAAMQSPELSLLGIAGGAVTAGTLFLEGFLGTPVAREEERTIFSG